MDDENSNPSQESPVAAAPSQNHECCVCFSAIPTDEGNWSCSECQNRFHMTCILRWTLRTMLNNMSLRRRRSQRTFTCPMCRHPHPASSLTHTAGATPAPAPAPAEPMTTRSRRRAHENHDTTVSASTLLQLLANYDQDEENHQHRTVSADLIVEQDEQGDDDEDTEAEDEDENEDEDEDEDEDEFLEEAVSPTIYIRAKRFIINIQTLQLPERIAL